MTALRPEHEAGHGGPYEQGAYDNSGAFEATAFEAAVEGLADPLNDPLPGQRGPVQEQGRGRRRGRPAEESPDQGPRQPLTRPAGPAAGPPADPESEWSGDYYRQYAAETPPAARGPQGEWPGTPPYYADAQTAPLPPIAAPSSPSPSRSSSPGTAPGPAPSPSVPPSPSAPISGVGPGPARDDETVGLRTADTRRAAEPEPGGGEGATAPFRQEESVSLTGGRAERRKAAARGGRGRRRPETASAASAMPAGSDGSAGSTGSARSEQGGSGGPAPARPLSRVEARRAARAAKDSLAVVASRAVGELFITFGVLMLLFVTYQLWWTNIRADQYAGKETNKIQESWTKDRQPGAFEPGQGFAIMHIPKLDVVVPIAEGISKAKVLDRGMVGHYAEGGLKTAMPSEKQGNFAVAGHRNTHGEPFRYINQLQPGDEIIVETRDAYYTYDMTSILPQTSPSNVSVIGPVPPGSGFRAPGRYITLTTCTPEFTSTYRMIVWGKMVEERPRSEGKPDALVG
ncbi:class E sortase [Streptomyces sp. NPDC002018]|uniref:class E sortase n=1 Tax=Streptomyces sp. NPDC002018 TaxID=3364629 RepID=UPI0036BEB997